jgi:hypothetical protein
MTNIFTIMNVYKTVGKQYAVSLRFVALNERSFRRNAVTACSYRHSKKAM